MLEMTYNSVREDLVIPEYGRVVHDMVQHMLGQAVPLCAELARGGC
jgi:hypothetical protein